MKVCERNSTDYLSDILDATERLHGLLVALIMNYLAPMTRRYMPLSGRLR